MRVRSRCKNRSMAAGTLSRPWNRWVIHFSGATPAAGDELRHAGHPEPAAAAAHALDRLVPIAKAPEGRVVLQGRAAKIGAQVHERSALFQDGQAGIQRVLPAAAQEDARPPGRRSPGRFGPIPRRMGTIRVRGAKFLRHRKAGPARPTAKTLPAPWSTAARPHSPTARAQHRDRGAELQAELAHALKGCAHHVRHHHRLLQADALGDARQVPCPRRGCRIPPQRSRPTPV